MSISDIDKFWVWFQNNETALREMLEGSNAEALRDAIEPQVAKIDKRLQWEVGPGKSKPFSLAISAGGHQDLRQTADEVCAKAPLSPSWEFYSFRQPRDIPPVIELLNPELSLATSNWLFRPRKARDNIRWDIIVVSDELAGLSENRALTAVFIYLDSVLGEKLVEQWIGDIRIAKAPTGLSPLYPMKEISMLLP
jgi:hypothetical protein